MDDEERFIFDLSGFIVLENVLSPSEIDRLNAALDAHDHLASRSPSYSGSHRGMIGEGNPVGRICTALVDQAGASGEELTFEAAASALQDAGFPGDGPTADTEQLRATLQALELPSGPLAEPQIEDLIALAEPATDGVIKFGSTRIDLGGMLEWEQPHCEPFRELLVHPRVKPALQEILGAGEKNAFFGSTSIVLKRIVLPTQARDTHREKLKKEALFAGYRMDHAPDLMRMEKGGDGQTLHGGGFERYSAGGMLESYSFHANKMFAGMVVVEFMLADEGPGDGGVAVVQGSHKSNYPAPTSLKVGERWQQHVTEVHAKKGDVVIFCEACVHGT